MFRQQYHQISIFGNKASSIPVQADVCERGSVDACCPLHIDLQHWFGPCLDDSLKEGLVGLLQAGSALNTFDMCFQMLNCKFEHIK